MAGLEIDPNADKIAALRERKLVELSAVLLKKVRDISEAQTGVEMLPLRPDPISKNKMLVRLGKLVGMAAELIEVSNQFEVKRFGDVNLVRSAAVVANLANSLLDRARQVKCLAEDTIYEAFDKMSEQLKPITNAASIKLGVTPQGKLLKLRTARAEIGKRLKELEATPIISKAKARNFGDLASLADTSGQSIMDLVEKRYKEIDDLMAKDKALQAQEKVVSDVSLHEAIADDNIQNLSRLITGETQELIKAVNASGVGSTKPYAIIRSSVIVLGTINAQRFRDAGFPVHRIGSQWMLMDQYVLAISEKKDDSKLDDTVVTRSVLRKPEPKKLDKRAALEKSKKLQDKIKSAKPVKKVVEEEPLSHNLTVDEILVTLKAKGQQWVDVAANEDGRSSKFMRVNSIKGVKFVWLMKHSDFVMASKNMPFRIQGVALPSNATNTSGGNAPKETETEKMRRLKAARLNRNEFEKTPEGLESKLAREKEKLPFKPKVKFKTR